MARTSIDEQIKITDKKMVNRHPWGTIDKVRHLGSDGKQHDYSSKPPLFPTLVAGVYKVVNLAPGMTLTDQPIYVAANHLDAGQLAAAGPLLLGHDRLDRPGMPE